MTNKNVLKCVTAIALFFGACSKDNNGPSQPPVQPANGLYILDEGAFNTNTAMVTYYDFATNKASDDIFRQENNIGLGDVANDMIIYGAKMYVVVNNSNKVVITDAKTVKVAGSVTIKQPRYAVGYQNKVLVTSWEGNVTVIDTTSLQIEKTIAVGKNPEGLAIVGTNLYVANSGALSYPTYDNSVSVVDLNTMQESKKITVGVDPQKVLVNSEGNVYVTTYGVSAANPSKIYVIDSKTNSLKDSINSPSSGITIFNDVLYSFFIEYDASFMNIKSITYPVIDTKTKTITKANFISDGTNVIYPYGINVDENNGDVYITDVKDFVSTGDVFSFDKSGKLKFKFSVTPGVGPKKVLFIR